jgi:hypothetical protein
MFTSPLPPPPATANQPFELVGYGVTSPRGRTEVAKFVLLSKEDEPLIFVAWPEIIVSDAIAFDEALNWVFGEYNDVMRNLAA